MAIVNGDNYAKMYVNEPKELGEAGLQHVKMRVLADTATANIADDVYIGELPENAIVISFGAIGFAGTLTMKDGDGNAIVAGDRVASRVKCVLVPAVAALAGELIVVTYLQC